MAPSVFIGTTSAPFQQPKPYPDVPVAINFSDKILIVYPTAFYLGRAAIIIAFVSIAVGVASCFFGDVLMPARVWIAAAVPIIAIGGMLIGMSLRRG